MSFLTERFFQVLDDHRLYSGINSQKSLTYFLERHVICAWTYQNLLRSLQRDLLGSLPALTPDPRKEAIRLISEIILDEEVDDLGDGRILSHLELYLEAMEDLGCNMTPILAFFDLLDEGIGSEKAFDFVNFPDEVVSYARFGMKILEKPIHARAAALFYEGEPFIPDRFLLRIDQMGRRLKVGRFIDYMERHIEGLKRPGFSAAGRLVELLCQNDANLNREAEMIAEAVMNRRIELWDAIATGLDRLPPGDFLLSPPAGRLRLVR